MSNTTQAVIHSWHERARAYHTLTNTQPVFQAMADRLIDLLPAPFNGTAIDLAAGAGLVSELLLSRWPQARVYLVEPAQAMLDQALQRLAHHRIGWTRLQAETHRTSPNPSRRCVV